MQGLKQKTGCCIYIVLILVLAQATKLMQGLIPDKDDKDYVQLSSSHYEHLYIFTVMWSVGAFLELDDRSKLEVYIRGNGEFSLDLPKLEVQDSTMFDYFVDKQGKEKHAHRGVKGATCLHNCLLIKGHGKQNLRILCKHL